MSAPVTAPPRPTGQVPAAFGRATSLLDRPGLPLLRGSMAVVLVWFGALKVAGVPTMPGALIAAILPPFIDAGPVIVLAGVFEVALGVGLLLGRFQLLVLAGVAAQMSATFLVLVLRPDVAFVNGNPLALSVEGEYVVKNLVLLAATLTLAGHHLARRRDEIRSAAGAADERGGSHARRRSRGPLRVVIVGAGFAGMAAWHRLRRSARRGDVDVTLIDGRNHHTFQPLLFQVATGVLAGGNVALPVRDTVPASPTGHFRLGTVAGIDPDQRLRLTDGATVPFDIAVVAAGAVPHLPRGVPGVREHAWPLKSIGDAVRLRDHILVQVEQAAVDPTASDPAHLTVVVVGGGPTGVEVAAAVRELFDHPIRRDFPELHDGIALWHAQREP